MEALWISSAFVCLMATLASVANAGSAIVLASRRGHWRSAQATVTGHGSRDEEFQLAHFLMAATVAAITGLLLALIPPPWIHPALVTAFGGPG